MQALAECAERVRAAAGAGGRLRVRGGGTKDFLAGTSDAEPLDDGRDVGGGGTAQGGDGGAHDGILDQNRGSSG